MHETPVLPKKLKHKSIVPYKKMSVEYRRVENLVHKYKVGKGGSADSNPGDSGVAGTAGKTGCQGTDGLVVLEWNLSKI